MFKFRVFIIAFSLMAAFFTLQSSAASVKPDLNFISVAKSTDVKSITDKNTASQTTTASFIDSTQALLVTKKIDVTHHKKTNQTGFEAHQPRLIASNSSLFLYGVQTEPQYDVVYEFFALTIAKQIYLKSQPVNAPQPWYTLVSKSKKLRLSGWKDANLLYTAVITYHA
jgi:hypothetical protein